MKKIKNLISIMIVSAILSGCAETSSESINTTAPLPGAEATQKISFENLSFDERIASLEWGMWIDEIKQILIDEPDSTANETTDSGETQTLFTYENQVFEGYDAYLIVCVVATKGLDGINYHIPTNSPEAVYQELGKMLSDKGGVYDPTTDTFSLWHFDDDNYTVMLANFGGEVQLSYYPLFAEEYRGVNCGEEFVYEETEYNNTDTETEPEQYFFMLDNTLTECDPIDKTIDCEEIILDRANYLQGLMHGFLNHNEDELVFELGESFTDGPVTAYKVVSNTIKSRQTIIDLFSDKIYEGYIDNLLSYDPSFFEMNDELYFIEADSGLLGVFETWYLGCDVTDDKIIGHFAVLGGVEDIGIDDAEYLNDENNYKFYDIIVQNVGGKYVITDCNAEITKGSYFHHHGYYYNSGKADRTLITNENVKPKFVEEK